MAQGKPKEKGTRWMVLLGIVLAALLFIVAAYVTLGSVIRRLALDFFYPYLAVKTLVAGKLSDATLLLYSKSELANRVEALREQNRTLAAQSAAARSLAHQNEELRRILQLPPRAQWSYRAAEIILRDPLNWTGSFVIDRGRDQGVRPGAAVFTVSTNGLPILVGVVRQVSNRTAQVVTTFNRELKLSCELERSGVTGIVNADRKALAEGLQSVGFLPLNGGYAVDEAFSTTGLESDIPPGLKIGNLVSVERPSSVFSNQMYVNAVLRPSADLNSIRFVVVATRL